MFRNRLFVCGVLMAVVGVLSLSAEASAASSPAGTVWSYGQPGYVYRAGGARVTATHTATGRSYSVVADSQGAYYFGPLPAGSYRITASYYNPRTRRTDSGGCASLAHLNGFGGPAYGFNINVR